MQQRWGSAIRSLGLHLREIGCCWFTMAGQFCCSYPLHIFGSLWGFSVVSCKMEVLEAGAATGTPASCSSRWPPGSLYIQMQYTAIRCVQSVCLTTLPILSLWAGSLSCPGKAVKKFLGFSGISATAGQCLSSLPSFNNQRVVAGAALGGVKFVPRWFFCSGCWRPVQYTVWWERPPAAPAAVVPLASARWSCSVVPEAVWLISLSLILFDG